MIKDKKAFIIIFSKEYFYLIGAFIILFFGYSYLIDNGIIPEENPIGKFIEGTPKDINLIESEVHKLVNEQRVLNGIPTLEYDSKISDRARSHSNRMAINNFFEHDNLIGKEMGENIAYTPIGNVEGCGGVYNEIDIAICTVDGWMNSPGHRENILTNWFVCEGIGVAISSTDEVYITQKFC